VQIYFFPFFPLFFPDLWFFVANVVFLWRTQVHCQILKILHCSNILRTISEWIEFVCQFENCRRNIKEAKSIMHCDLWQQERNIFRTVKTIVLYHILTNHSIWLGTMALAVTCEFKTTCLLIVSDNFEDAMILWFFLLTVQKLSASVMGKQIKVVTLWFASVIVSKNLKWSKTYS
jgi:hypothetical protein